MRKLQTALIQMNPSSYALQSNLKLALKLASQAINYGAKLIVLPELFDSGYCVSDKDAQLAIDLHSPQQHKSFAALSAFARDHRIHLIACSIEKDKDQLYDCAYIIDPAGKLLGKQRKIYLWSGEKQRFSRGSSQEVFTLDFGDFTAKVGIGICYEIGFGEIARALALQQAEIIIYPSAFGKARTYVWDLASRARALENGCFVLACNRSGEESQDSQKFEFAGCSRVINPKGEILAQATDENQCLIASIDLDEIMKQREALPYLEDLKVR